VASVVPVGIARVLARCNGFTVIAGGEVVGAVATPVFSGTKLLPDYLLVRVAESIPGAYRAIPPALITQADPESETVFLEIGLDEVRVLPEPETHHRS
jgi:hypothetical protein